ncbi:MAG: DUF3372 domain-containing protein, partial [Chloroflexaceae bacterium]|nr:DUF3372 domain-containing protein [Chloroflexaceae bacterium]
MPCHRWKALPTVVLFTLLALLAALLPLQATPAARAQEQTPPPKTVTIPGTIQSKLGCPGDWQPACEQTFLTYDQAADLWRATFDLPAGDYEYKAALNGTWAENYGAKAARNGANIALKLAAPTSVTFIYDHKTT